MPLLFTYTNKGPATAFVYASNQRPMTKYDSIPNIPGKPNPIKQWRKQLQPSLSQNKVHSHATIQTLDHATRTDASFCNSYTDIYKNEQCEGLANKPCINIRRSANTIINKKFCWNSKQYLQSRCKTYDQNQTLGTPTGTPNEYFGASCTTKVNSTGKVEVCKPVVHKPNNKQFSQQGGVSSSSRIAKLKYDTIVNSTNKYDSLLANLDQSAHILNRKPVPCRGWRVKGNRPYSAKCNQVSSIDNL
jgi:hypothetical protein